MSLGQVSTHMLVLIASNNVPLDIHLHDDLFLLIACTVPCNTHAARLIDVVGLGWGVEGRIPRSGAVNSSIDLDRLTD